MRWGHRKVHIIFYKLKTQGDQKKIKNSHLSTKNSYFLFSRMTGATWANQEQTEFLYTFIAEYYKINNGDKNYVPFWTRLREEWFIRYPEHEVCFPDREVDNLLPDEQAQVTENIKIRIKVTELFCVLMCHFD